MSVTVSVLGTAFTVVWAALPDTPERLGPNNLYSLSPSQGEIDPLLVFNLPVYASASSIAGGGVLTLTNSSIHTPRYLPDRRAGPLSADRLVRSDHGDVQ